MNRTLICVVVLAKSCCASRHRFIFFLKKRWFCLLWRALSFASTSRLLFYRARSVSLIIFVGCGLSALEMRLSWFDPCSSWRFVHAEGTTHFRGAAHMHGAPYAHRGKCASCGVAVCRRDEAGAPRIAAHVMAYKCGHCNCCCARLTLKTTCKACNDAPRGASGCFWCTDERAAFMGYSPRDANNTLVYLYVPKSSGHTEGCIPDGYVFQPSCCLRDYRWADPASVQLDPRSPGTAIGAMCVIPSTADVMARP